MKKLETYEWWPEMVSLKDELSLRELGERFGVTPGAIMNAFRRNGIERKPAPPGPRAHRKRSGDALPPEPGEGGAARPGSKDAQIDAHKDLLGTVPDRVVAKKAGVSLRTVAAYRARMGIAGYKGPRKKGSRTRKSKIDPFAQLVGTVPDRIVAEKAGVSVNAVRNWRRVRGVAAVGRGRPPATAQVAAQAIADAPIAAVPSSGSIAWKITLAAAASGVVVGSDLLDAAQKAQLVGEVTAMERIGAVLA